MTTTPLKENKWAILAALGTSLFLSLTVISPAFASVQQDIQAQKNCANLKYDINKEVRVLGDSDAGTVSLSYTDDIGVPQDTWLDLKGDSTNCSPQARKLIATVKASQDKYNSDMCNEATAIVEGREPLPEMDGKKPTIEATKVYQKAICALAARK